MNDYKQLIDTFYNAFAARDYETMGACYHAEVQFADPVFNLRGKEAAAMWHMLCESGRDLKVVHSDVWADDTTGRAHWEAWYTFSTGRKVHNIIEATFRFQDGRIISHQDRFGFWRWTRQALGPTGLVLGWTPLVRNQVRKTARQRLDRFIAAHPEYQP